MRWILIGGGGHAKAVADMLALRGQTIAGYLALEKTPGSPWTYLGGDKDTEIPAGSFVALGLGGVTPEGLTRRLDLLDYHQQQGHTAPPIVSPHAIIAGSADIGTGSTIMMGVSIQAAAKIGMGAIINTGAIIEHDCIIGDGAHIAPGAIVLGGCRIGRCAMIGAGAIILPGAEVPDQGMVSAGKRLAADT
ncbi:hypothetical protein [Aestuariispira ectoiniformans]|uniref:hypothetical protein n=1 Tax=Aestuariispira ectoiniformans TaxID=2775080 RepID=UPI00223B13DD|nr:hypothetical protein [Aestuariispira ectoiniformans]